MKTRKRKGKAKPAQVVAWEVSAFVYQYYLADSPGKLLRANGAMLAALCRRGHPVAVALRVPFGAVADLVYANGRVAWYVRPSGKPDRSAS